MIEENSREVKNDPVALNIWWNLHILRDALRRVRIKSFYLFLKFFPLQTEITV